MVGALGVGDFGRDSTGLIVEGNHTKLGEDHNILNVDLNVDNC